MSNYWQRPDRKVVVDLAVSVVTFVLLGFGVQLTPEVNAVVSKAVGTLVAYFVPNKE